MKAKTIAGKTVTFLGSSAGAFALLCFLGNKQKALEALSMSLAALLSAAIGWVSALLFPNPKPEAGEKPDPVREPTTDPESSSSTIPLSEYNRVVAELESLRNELKKSSTSTVPLPEYERSLAESESLKNNLQSANLKLAEWRDWKLRIEDYIRTLKNGRVALDTSQTVLRTTLYGVVAISFFICFAGFLAPPFLMHPVFPNEDAMKKFLASTFVVEKFMPHLAVLAVPFASIGFLMGVVVCGVRAFTTAYGAFKCALLSSSLVGIVSLLVALPYTFHVMWMQKVPLVDINWSMQVWFAIFRLVAAPFLCACCAYSGFWLAQLVKDKLNASTKTP